jgi:uncharacterized membrane protein (UPF0127 family)
MIRSRPHRTAARACLLALLLAAACTASEEGSQPAVAAGLPTTRVQVGGETFTVEVAADRASRTRGLSRRTSIPRNGGMLFVLPGPTPFTMVMRHCPNPIDVAFIDPLGRVVSIQEMVPEPPKRADESPFEYESRLRPYTSGVPVQFALETAGGRLAEVGLHVGDRVHFDARSLVAKAR